MAATKRHKKHTLTVSGAPLRQDSFGIYSSANYAGTDQGVDYRGKGTIPALASGIVTDVGRATIIEGQRIWYVIYKATTGAYKGHYFYVAENFLPTVKKGQHVKLGQSIGYALGKYPFTETGFNKTGVGWNPSAPLYPNPHGSKAAGAKMKTYIDGVIGLRPPVTGGGKGSGDFFVNPSLSNLGHLFLGTGGGFEGTGIGGNAVSGIIPGVHPLAWIDKLLDAFAIIGGGFIFVLGFVLIAVDMGRRTGATQAVTKAGETLYIGKGINRVAKKTKPQSSQPTVKLGSGEKRVTVHHYHPVGSSGAKKAEKNYDPSTSEIPF